MQCSLIRDFAICFAGEHFRERKRKDKFSPETMTSIQKANAKVKPFVRWQLKQSPVKISKKHIAECFNSLLGWVTVNFRDLNAKWPQVHEEMQGKLVSRLIRPSNSPHG
jgi:hypothetical protein